MELMKFGRPDQFNWQLNLINPPNRSCTGIAVLVCHACESTTKGTRTWWITEKDVSHLDWNHMERWHLMFFNSHVYQKSLGFKVVTRLLYINVIILFNIIQLFTHLSINTEMRFKCNPSSFFSATDYCGQFPKQHTTVAFSILLNHHLLCFFGEYSWGFYENLKHISNSKRQHK